MCDRCKFCDTNNMEPRNINCYLCNYNIGSLKKVQNNRWAHIICVNWIPEIYFKDPMYFSFFYSNKFFFCLEIRTKLCAMIYYHLRKRKDKCAIFVALKMDIASKYMKDFLK